MAIVYETLNKLNGKKYIGVDTKNNPEYMGSGVLLKYAIKKYGKSNFIKRILIELETPTLAFEHERALILELNAIHSVEYYNLAEGGHGGWTHTGNTSPISEERKQKISVANSGRTFTDEHKRKIGDVHRGKVVTNKTRMKMSKSASGRLHSETTKLNMSNYQSNNIHPLAKEVVINGKYFMSVTKAAIHLGISTSTVTYRIKSKNFNYEYK